MSRVRHLLARLGALTTGLVVCFWFIIALRAIPVPAGDYGMFVTVAERLKAGDRLYVDVYENKDPFFHYALALGRSVTPYAGWILEVLWLLVASFSALSIARAAGIAFRTSVILGFISVPAIMTGFTYFAGVSHLPGVALAILSLALALRMRAVLAGLAVGSLLFVKLVMFPIGVLFVLMAFLMQSRLRLVAVAAISALGAIAVAVVLMVVRGEFLPYLAALQDNAVYAGTQETSTGLSAALEHLRKVLVPNNALLLVTTVALVVAAAVMSRRVLKRSEDPIGAALAWSSLGATALALGVLSQTGLWVHHAQILVPGAALALILFMARGPAFARGSSAIAIWTAIALAVPLTGLPSPRAYVTPVEYARAIIWEQSRLAPSTELILSTGSPTTFARVGGGNDGGFGRGLVEWTMVCPLFGQSTLTTPAKLADMRDCLPRANVIFVDTDAVGGDTDSPWDEFIRGVEGLLASSYSCRVEPVGRICVRTDYAASAESLTE